MNVTTDTRESERYGWYVVFVLCVCGVVAYIDRQIINLLVEDIKIDLGVSDTEISLLQGFAFAVFYALVAIPLGRVADSKNRRLLITAGILAWTAAAVACGLAQSYPQLFVARMFVGVGEAVLTPAGFSLLADLFRPQRLARPVSVFTASSFFGSGIALVVGGFIVNQLTASGGVTLPVIGDVAVWQGAFILGALPGIPVAIWFFLSVREPPRRATDTIQADAAAYREGFSQAIRYVFANARLFFAVFIGLSLMASAQFALGAWIPAFFIRVHEWTAGDIGSLQGLLFLVCGTLGVISGGWATDALRQRGYRDANLRTAVFAALLAIPFLTAVPAVADPYVAIVLLAPGMFFGTVPFGAGAAVIPTVSPPMFRAQLVALYLLVANLVGSAGGPWGVAFMTDAVFADDRAVGKSLMVVVPVLLAMGAAIATTGWRPLAAKTRDAND
ncbi:MAG: MFS transporter [Pseudomonadota bacterium]